MKKNYTLTIVAILFSFVAQAQLSAGTFYLGGTLGFASSTSDNKVGNTETRTFENSSFTAAPSLGFFVADKTAVGLRASISSTKNTFIQNNGDKRITTSAPISVGLFAERYFMMIPQFGFTAGVNANFVGGSSKTENIDGTTGVNVTTENTISGFNSGLTAGTIWFPNPHIGVSAQVGLINYATTTSTVKDANPEMSTTNSGVTANLSSMNLAFGFHYYFFH